MKKHILFQVSSTSGEKPIEGDNGSSDNQPDATTKETRFVSQSGPTQAGSPISGSHSPFRLVGEGCRTRVVYATSHADPRSQDIPENQGRASSAPTAEPSWRERFPELAASLSYWPPDGCGVYFLFLGGLIQYIGASGYPSHRVWQHRRKGRVFNEDLYLACPVELLLTTEAYWIQQFLPPHNRVHCRKCADPWGR